MFRRNKKHLGSITTLMAFAMLTACSLQSKMDEMHDDTAKMGKTTGEMNDKTTRLITLSEELRRLTQDLNEKATHGATADLRVKYFDAVANAESPSRKLGFAAKYFSAFEFQYWTGVGDDSEERRLEFADLALKEFLRDVQDFIVNVQAPPEGMVIQNSKMSLNAMAAAMSVLDIYQERILRRNKLIKEMSVYGLLLEGLSYKAKLQTGKVKLSDIPAFARTALNFEKVVIHLLQARHSQLALMYLAKVSPLRNAAEDRRVLSLEWFKILFQRPSETKPWQLNLNELNDAELAEASHYLAGAVETKAQLLKLGVDTGMDPGLVKWMGNFVDVTVKSEEFSAQTKSLQNQVLGLMKKYLE